jgi:anti-sigma B factor antagonist
LTHSYRCSFLEKILEISISEQEGVTVCAIHGSVDSLSADALTSGLAAPIAKGQTSVVADFSNVTYTSSAGLRSLLSTVKDCRRAGGDLRIAALQPQVERVLAIAGFTSIIKTYPDVAAAVASFGAA